MAASEVLFMPYVVIQDDYTLIPDLAADIKFDYGARLTPVARHFFHPGGPDLAARHGCGSRRARSGSHPCARSHRCTPAPAGNLGAQRIIHIHRLCLLFLRTSGHMQFRPEHDGSRPADTLVEISRFLDISASTHVGRGVLPNFPGTALLDLNRESDLPLHLADREIQGPSIILVRIRRQ